MRVDLDGLRPGRALRALCALSLALVLPSCCDDPLRGSYRLAATLRDPATGRVAMVTSGDADLMGGFNIRYCDDRDFNVTRARVLREWSRFLRRRVADASAPESVRTRFAGGNWCLASSGGDVFPHGPTFHGGGDPCPAPTCPPESTEPELPACPAMPPPPIACDMPGAPAGTPSLALTSESLDFGGLPVGQRAAPRAITVSNSGGGALCLRALDFNAMRTRHPGDFELDRGDCRPSTPDDLRNGAVVLMGGRTCSFSASFLPQADGPRQAVVQVDTNDAARPQVLVNLAGTGNAGRLLTNEAPLCFNVPPDGSGCRRRGLIFTNEGPGTVTVSSLALPVPSNWSIELITPPGVATLPPAGVTLAPGERLTVNLVTCTDTGRREIFVAASNATMSPAEVALLPASSGCSPR
jgi:hypothetical protein